MSLVADVSRQGAHKNAAGTSGPGGAIWSESDATLVPMVARLEGAIGGDADVVGLFLGEHRQLGTQFFQVKHGN